MKNKYKCLKSALIILILFCISITPIILAEEVNAASTSYEYQVLDLVNKERSKVGITPLKMDNELFNAAKTRTKEIGIVFSHTRPDETSWFTVSSKASGENIAKGYATPESVMDGWMNSPGHKTNILDPSFKSIGIGYLKGSTTYWVQLFGRGEADERVETNLIITTSYEVGNTNTQTSTNNPTPQNNNPTSTNNPTPQNNNPTSTNNPTPQNNNPTSTNNPTPQNNNPTSTNNPTPQNNNPTSTNNPTPQNNHQNTIKPGIPSFSLVSGNKKIIIKWKKVPKASGYQIYVSTKKNGKYILKKTIAKSSVLQCTHKNLKKKKYYYKLRSYTNNNEKKIYSKFSSIKSKTPK